MRELTGSKEEGKEWIMCTGEREREIRYERNEISEKKSR